MLLHSSEEKQLQKHNFLSHENLGSESDDIICDVNTWGLNIHIMTYTAVYHTLYVCSL